MNENNLMNSIDKSIKKTDKRIKIIDATIELVGTNGIHATPMSQVSKRASVAAGTIYHYFENKDALIQESYIHVKTRSVDAVLARDDTTLPYKARFLIFWQALYEYCLIPNVLSFKEQCAISPIIDTETHKIIEEYTQPIKDFLTLGMDKHHIKPLPCLVLYGLVAGSIYSMAKLKITHRIEGSESEISAAANFTWDGLVNKEIK